MGMQGNSELKVRISSDEMEAFLLLPVPGQGVYYTLPDLLKFLQNSRVTQGINEATLRQMIDEKQYGREIRVACGTKAVDGQDGFFQYNFNMDLNRKPTIREDGSVDYWSIHAIEIVEQGQVIAIYHDPVDGSNGMTVTGKPILAKRGRPLPPLAGKGFSRSEDNHTYVADLTGKIDFRNGRIQIQSIYEVSGDVDMRTGNIDFRGDVVVHGNVTVGAVVKATGSITVDGICEACVLEAGKDIILRGGVLGGHKAKIRSRSNIQAKFFEYSTVEAEGYISVNSALSSTLISYDRIFLDGKHASIVGGYTYATAGVEADTLGNVNEVKTKIQVGASTEVLRGIVDIKNRLSDAQAMLGKITEGLMQFEVLAKEKGLDINSDERRVALLRTKMAKQAEIAADTRDLERLNAIVERGQGAFVRVIRDVFPGTTITIHQTMLSVKDEQHSVDFVLRQGNVVMNSLKGVIV